MSEEHDTELDITLGEFEQGGADIDQLLEDDPAVDAGGDTDELLDLDDAGEDGEQEEERGLRRQVEDRDAELQRLRAFEQQTAQNRQVAEQQQHAQHEAALIEHLAGLSYDERQAALQELQRRRVMQNILMARDQADRAAFAKTARGVPKRLADQVEPTLAQARQNGNMSLTRDDVLNFLVGQEVRKRQAKPAGAGSGPVGRSRNRRQDASDEAILRGMTLGDYDQRTQR